MGPVEMLVKLCCCSDDGRCAKGSLIRVYALEIWQTLGITCSTQIVAKNHGNALLTLEST